jgi:hypothetical protein
MTSSRSLSVSSINFPWYPQNQMVKQSEGATTTSG